MKMPFDRMSPDAFRALARMLLNASGKVTVNDREDNGTVALSDDLVPVQRVQDARWLVTYRGDLGPITVVKLNADGTMVHMVRDDGVADAAAPG